MVASVLAAAVGLLNGLIGGWTGMLGRGGLAWFLRTSVPCSQNSDPW